MVADWKESEMQPLCLNCDDGWCCKNTELHWVEMHWTLRSVSSVGQIYQVILLCSLDGIVF